MFKVLVACERSGKVRDAFIKAGHDAISCDLNPSRSPGPHYQGDVLDILYDQWDLLIAHPVCKYLSNSGVRWLHEDITRWPKLFEAAKFYRQLRDAKHIPMRAIENPVMHRYAIQLIEPVGRQVVQPWWFGDKAFKATGLELIGLPELKPTNKLTPPKKGTQEHKEWSFIHRMPPGEDREEKRSETFPGIADAMANQWGSLATTKGMMK